MEKKTGLGSKYHKSERGSVIMEANGCFLGLLALAVCGMLAISAYFSENGGKTDNIAPTHAIPQETTHVVVIDSDSRCGAGPKFPQPGIRVSGGGHFSDKSFTRQGLNNFFDPICDQTVAAANKWGINVDLLSAFAAQETYPYGISAAEGVMSDCGAVGVWQVLASDYYPHDSCKKLPAGMQLFPLRPPTQELKNVGVNADVAAQIVRGLIDTYGDGPVAYGHYYGGKETDETNWYGSMVDAIAKTLRGSR